MIMLGPVYALKFTDLCSVLRYTIVGTGTTKSLVGICRVKRRLNMQNKFMSGVVWWLRTKMIKLWSNRYMDQWEKVKFETPCGTVYVTISRHDLYAESFDEIK